MGLRQTSWHGFYEVLARRVRRPEWAFMNYGFAPLDPAAPLALEPGDEADRFCIQLYEHVVAADLTGLDVLEVGCGRGGGASYLSRYRGPRSTTGVDLAAAAVATCARERRGPELRFTTGDAQALPFPDDSFDVVVNVESSHCYSSVPRFLAEVARVLRPGGRFFWADFRPAGEVERTRAELRASGLAVDAEQDVTAEVVRALDLDSDRKLALVRAWLPRVAHPGFARFAALPGSSSHRAFQERRTRYLSAALTAP
ncbi:ubiquinone/menaquinone biosynthesis C-methylase UbiE [Kineococcus radiotolerans]|uniref:Ubiquinone/menaquinone biosynthesis C-methylase UbiE n=1 Tax=Kineococcus radiotolerans TaxID=131568 RepID=A0A7W4TMD6_KINRA|nr:class I SAM-dependent methyltransferase [Kineococcus radiotolerans]MBB2901552.1 ubiquinone/menaquinone biosynthesis C-methylase UbiE [Kineococcus radiotolerans]